MKKLCCILPEYDSKSHTHFTYLIDFIKEISKSLDIFLIIERGERPAFELGCQRVYVLRFSFFLLRWLELKFRLLQARLLGYRDFYIHYSFFAAYIASWIVKITGGRTFYWNCGLPWKYKRNFFRERFEKFVYKMITFLVTGTESLKKDYAGHYGIPEEKIKVMPNWINLDKFKVQSSKFKVDELRAKLNIAKEQKVILFAHRLSKRKGAHYLPEIAKKLNAIIHNSSFIILVVGDGPEREALESNVKGQMSKVRMLGWIPNNELPTYYALADIFIMPSEEEGFPHVILEAMAVGTPFAAFNVGGVKEIMPTDLQSYAVKEGDINTFVSRIKELLEMSPRQRGAIQDIEQQWVKKFELKTVIELFKEIIIV